MAVRIRPDNLLIKLNTPNKSAADETEFVVLFKKFNFILFLPNYNSQDIILSSSCIKRKLRSNTLPPSNAQDSKERLSFNSSIDPE